MAKPGTHSHNKPETPEQENIIIGNIPRNILECPILIVDDDELHCQLISIILSRDGFCNLHFAHDGREALQQAQDLKPDLIILDILMPNIDGLEVCRKLRTIKQFRNIPIIAHTIKKSPEDRAEIYSAGATDIFPKPVSEREVQNRVYMHLKYARLVKGLKQYHQRLVHDLEIARSMQDALFPEMPRLKDISTSHKVAINYHYETSDELGGDFWGVDVVDKDRLFVYIIDFSGHGISSALNTFRLHSLISNYRIGQGRNIARPAEYLEKLNRDLFKLLPVEQFATMLCGIIDLKKDIFTYAAAAATVPVKLTVGNRGVTRLDPVGFPLGMIEAATYENRSVPFCKGDILFLYSDVLTESLDQKGRMIGDENFLELCEQINIDPARNQTFLDRLLKSFDMLVVRPLQDDLTAVTLERR